MKQLTCEMCGSTDVLKQDGIYVCQICGAKYTVEEAKKLIVEGTVKVDREEELKTTLEYAINEYHNRNYSITFAKCSDILQYQPHNWLATLYKRFSQDLQQSIDALDLHLTFSEAINIWSDCRRSVDFVGQSDYVNIWQPVSADIRDYACQLHRCLNNYFEKQESIIRTSSYKKNLIVSVEFARMNLKADERKLENFYRWKLVDIGRVMEELCKVVPLLEKVESDDVARRLYEDVRECGLWWRENDLHTAFYSIVFGGANRNSAWKQLKGYWEEHPELVDEYIQELDEINSEMNEIYREYVSADSGDLENNRQWKFLQTQREDIENELLLCSDLPEDEKEKIRILQNQRAEEERERQEQDTSRILEQLPSFPKASSTQTNRGGCYVATAVYGSYDCPEVWTLRRYRDNTLAESWYGRSFIRAYYAISPSLVKWFGNAEWFKKMWKGTLDRMVERFQKQGIASTPYEDREW